MRRQVQEEHFCRHSALSDELGIFRIQLTTGQTRDRAFDRCRGGLETRDQLRARHVSTGEFSLAITDVTILAEGAAEEVLNVARYVEGKRAGNVRDAGHRL